jgi:hypothetical protein
MKTISTLIIWLLSLSFALGQNEKRDYNEFLQSQFGTRFIDKGEFHDTIFQYDFSEIWTVKELNIDPRYFNPIRPEPLGFIGDNYQRLYMHFSEVEKVGDKKYYVKGKSKVRDNICDFEGYLTIKMAREFEIPYHEGADYVIDPRTITQGVLIGEYEFFEDPTQNHVGIFKGTFISSFHVTETRNVEYNVTSIFSDNYINNQFTGIWKPYNSSNERNANWGDYRIPQSGDLDIGAGGFSPADKYLKFGWQSYRDAYFSLERDENAIKKEKQKWWINK